MCPIAGSSAQFTENVVQSISKNLRADTQIYTVTFQFAVLATFLIWIGADTCPTCVFLCVYSKKKISHPKFENTGHAFLKRGSVKIHALERAY